MSKTDEQSRAETLNKIFSKTNDELTLEERVLVDRLRDLSGKRDLSRERMKNLNDQLQKLSEAIKKTESDTFAINVSMQALIDVLLEIDASKVTVEKVE